jgi:hypothetical protein
MEGTDFVQPLKCDCGSLTFQLNEVVCAVTASGEERPGVEGELHAVCTACGSVFVVVGADGEDAS